MFTSILFVDERPEVTMPVVPYTDWYAIGYIVFSFLGAALTLTAIDNVSKLIKSGFGKDMWNVEGESFMQDTKPVDSQSVVNIPMQFYYKGKVHNGYIPISVLRGTLVLGVPGSGKSYGIINPCIRTLLGHDYTMCLYDFKYPDLAKIAYYHYLLAKQQGRMRNYRFHVLNLNDVSASRRINPLKAEYVRTLAEASEISEAIVEAMKKGDNGGGSDQFFTQSAINFLSACVYFLSKYEDGKYSTFAHVLALLNRSYEEIFSVLYTNPELESLLSPFYSAFKKKAFDQLEGQIGTLKVFISRLATKESFWVFSGEDFELKISDPEHPSILVLANDPSTVNINSALYALVLNRLSRLLNTKGNLPSSIVADESPSLYFHKVDLLIAQVRSNRCAVILGLQSIKQLQQQYGKDAAETLSSVVGNILCGSVRDRESLDWLEKLFGKVKQTGESLSIDRSKTSISLSERLEPLIPAGKIASLKTSEVVGIVARDVQPAYTGEYHSSAFNCKVNLPKNEINREEAGYRELPMFYDFKGKKDEVLTANFRRINGEIKAVVESFMEGL